MEKHFKTLDLNKYRNAYVVGDIHGRFDLLEEKLKEIGFDKQQDFLLGVGDLIDRGKQSNRVVRYLNQPWVEFVEGNHESLAISGAFDSYFARTHKRNGGEWFYRLDEDERAAYARLFLKLPIAIEAHYRGKTYGLVHADVYGNDWNTFKQALLKFNGRSDGQRSVADVALWSRSRLRDWFTGFNHDNHAPISGIDQVYVGHTIVDQPFAIHNINYIDTGAFATEVLTIVPLGELLPQAPKHHPIFSQEEHWG